MTSKRVSEFKACEIAAKHRYQIEYKRPGSNEWLPSGDSFRFLWRANNEAFGRASLGVLDYRVVDTRKDECNGPNTSNYSYRSCYCCRCSNRCYDQ